MTDRTDNNLKTDSLHDIPITALGLKASSVAFLQANYQIDCDLTVGDLVEGMRFLHLITVAAKPGMRELFFGEIKAKLIEHGYWAAVEPHEQA